MACEAFHVIEPPTSEGVRERAVAAVAGDGIMRLTLLSDREIPAPEETEVSFDLLRLHRPKNEPWIATGQTEAGASVVVNLSADMGEAATATMVTVDDIV